MTGDQGTSIREDVVVLLARASGSALRTANAALEPFGFRARHYATVKIAAEGGGVPQRQIGAVLGLDPSAVVALVDDLESARSGPAATRPGRSAHPAGVADASGPDHAREGLPGRGARAGAFDGWPDGRRAGHLRARLLRRVVNE